jgi:hypothetical protein
MEDRVAQHSELQTAQPLSPEQARLLDSWWRAANYLSVGQIYLLDNPLLRERRHSISLPVGMALIALRWSCARLDAADGGVTTNAGRVSFTGCPRPCA